MSLLRRWRRDLLTSRLMPVVGCLLPRLGETERAAHLAGLLSDEELALLRDADRARDEAIQVDAFSVREFPRMRE